MRLTRIAVLVEMKMIPTQETLTLPETEFPRQVSESFIPHEPSSKTGRSTASFYPVLPAITSQGPDAPLFDHGDRLLMSRP